MLMKTCCIFLTFLFISGCSSIVKNWLYPLTEHGKCVSKCENKYKDPNALYMKTVCKQRCDRDLGWEESKPK